VAEDMAVKMCKRGHPRIPENFYIRLNDIDWEYDELKPGLLALEKRITIVGELPTFTVEEEPDDDGKDDMGK
jgi:hypothetical protein